MWALFGPHIKSLTMSMEGSKCWLQNGYKTKPKEEGEIECMKMKIHMKHIFYKVDTHTHIHTYYLK